MAAKQRCHRLTWAQIVREALAPPPPAPLTKLSFSEPAFVGATCCRFLPLFWWLCHRYSGQTRLQVKLHKRGGVIGTGGRCKLTSSSFLTCRKLNERDSPSYVVVLSFNEAVWRADCNAHWSVGFSFVSVSKTIDLPEPEVNLKRFSSSRQ